jgi:hypothetical protein
MQFFSHVIWLTTPARWATRQQLSSAAKSGLPDFGQEAGNVQLGKHLSVNPIGLDLGFGNQAHLARIGDRDPGDVRRNQPGNIGRVVRCSSTTWSLGWRERARLTTASCSSMMRPAERTRRSLWISRSAKEDNYPHQHSLLLDPLS